MHRVEQATASEKQAQKENEGNSLLILPMKRIISIFIKYATHAWLITKINEGFKKFKFTQFYSNKTGRRKSRKKKEKSHCMEKHFLLMWKI